MNTQERLQAALAQRYRVERELGQGGMATVYLAEDLRHHRNIVMKVLLPDLAASIGAKRRCSRRSFSVRSRRPRGGERATRGPTRPNCAGATRGTSTPGSALCSRGPASPRALPTRQEKVE